MAQHQPTGQSQPPVDESQAIDRVHLTPIDIASIEVTPPHPERKESPEYVRVHHHLIFELDTPCKICGVRQSTLGDSRQNPFGAQYMETHHYPIEWSLADACDPAKVGVDFPGVKDRDSLNAFIDSEQNLMVLCNVHHLSPQFGIHRLSVQDFFIQRYVYSGYQVVATRGEDATQVVAQDQKVVTAEAGVQVTMQDGTTVGVQAQVVAQGGAVAEAQAEVRTEDGTGVGAQAEATTKDGVSVAVEAQAQVTSPREPAVNES